MVIEILLIAGVFKIMKNPQKYNYVEYGRPKDDDEPKQKKKINWKAILIPGYTK